MAISEVSIPFRYKTKRSSAVSWVASHALRHWYIFLVGIIGAIGNAALASVPALQYGLVFENLTSGNPSPSVFLRAGAIVGISQVSRGFLQFFRNAQLHIWRKPRKNMDIADGSFKFFLIQL